VTAGLRIGLIPKVLYLYTRNPESLSIAARRSEQWEREKALLAETNPEWPGSIRRRIRCIRLLRKFLPARYDVPLPSTPRA
jgi:hypothetical protein